VRRRWAVAAGLVATAGLLAACVQASADPTHGTRSASRSTSAATTPVTTSPSSTGSPSSAPGPAAISPAVVVGLGDSVTAGTACHCTDFVTLYAGLLGRRVAETVRPVNLGVAGLTTTTLAAQLSAVTTRATLSGAGEVVVTIGANDLTPLIAKWQSGGCDSTCIAPASAAMGSRLQSVLAQLRAEAPGARVLVTSYWNVFEDGDVADADYGAGFAAWSDAVTRSANAAIRAAADANDDETVDLYAPFEGRGERNPTSLLADDGDHPNAAGHRLIAQALLAASASG
jgi:lysophospholipase L1-like esterase